MSNRDLFVDYAKGIGIILVVYGHVLDGVYRSSAHFAGGLFEAQYAVIYSFHMPLFFFLSGLYIQHSLAHRSSGEFFANKLRTIAYPYLLWSLLQGGLEVVLSRYTNGHVTFSQVAVLLWHPRAQFWFLYALFLILALSNFVLRIPGRGTTAAFTLCAAALYLHHGHLFSIFPINEVANYLVYFTAGALLSRVVLDGSRAHSGAATLLAVAGLAAFWGYRIGVAHDLRLEGVEALLLAFAGIGAVLLLSKWLAGAERPWLTLLGRNSLQIYLAHVIFASGARVIFQHLLGLDGALLNIVAGTLFGIVGPLLLALWAPRFGLPYLFQGPRLRPLAQPSAG